MKNSNKKDDTAKNGADKTLAPGLYIIATPIGNMSDITLRAINVLGKVDAIYCEDTREAKKLCQAYQLTAQLFSYHDHNRDQAEQDILKKLAAGLSVALISDAGMPLISDPGFGVVRNAVAAGYGVTCVPGASASLTALVLSGLPTDRFYFAGFLPSKKQARQKELQALCTIPATLVFYETAPRLIESLQDMSDILGVRAAAVARELTKMFEEVRRGSLQELLDFYGTNGAPKGEIVIVVQGAKPETEWQDDRIDQAIRALLAEGKTVKDIAQHISDISGRSKKDIYQRTLDIKN